MKRFLWAGKWSGAGAVLVSVFAAESSISCSQSQGSEGEASGDGDGDRSVGEGGLSGDEDSDGPPVEVEYVADVYQTSAAGERLTHLGTLGAGEAQSGTYGASRGAVSLTLTPETTFQEYFGFGASFTESSAWNLATIPAALRKEVLTRLFSPTQGAGFSLTRTHINSSDYSNNHYSYVEDGDEDLSTFSVFEDMRGFSGTENDQVTGVTLEEPSYDLIPMILEAQQIEGADFKIIASPWSPPSWMKTGETSEMTNGHLLTEYWPAWAAYFSKYLSAYREQGIDIWALTPQNEPLHASDARWDSNGFSAVEARDFLRDHLGPRLEADGHLDPGDLESGVRILIYDHNKSVMNEYVAPTYADPAASKYAWGTAFHWYTNSELDDNGYYASELAALHETYPDKVMIHTESSIDIRASDPIGQYFTDSTDYAGTFVPFTTYAYDIITDLNHFTQGYVEWCMILSHEGKPNPYDNFNSAPVLINPETDEVIYTPLYFVLSHFSKFIRPGAHRIASTPSAALDKFIHTAAQNPDGSLAVVAFNDGEGPVDLTVTHEGRSYLTQVAPHALMTVHLRAE